MTTRENLPEQQHHRTLPAEQRVHTHFDRASARAHLAHATGSLQNQTITAPIHETHEVVPAVAGEHVHHHVHEIIQPVIHRETVEKHVIHTTVPVREVHRHEPRHHALAALPPMSMEEWVRRGGATGGGRDVRGPTSYEGGPTALQSYLNSDAALEGSAPAAGQLGAGPGQHSRRGPRSERRGDAPEDSSAGEGHLASEPEFHGGGRRSPRARAAEPERMGAMGAGPRQDTIYDEGAYNWEHGANETAEGGPVAKEQPETPVKKRGFFNRLRKRSKREAT